ncbi:[FeFe] hydrogenase H-cluster radical SAM maturase HydE [Pseudomonadota bacterium]
MPHSLIKKAENEHNLSKDELVVILENEEINQELFDAANRVREKYVGNEVHLRGLLEFSNICSRNCHYCGLRKDNKNLQRYKLHSKVIVGLAKKAVSYGYKTLVLQSGEGSFYSIEDMVNITKEIKKLDVAVTLSIGEKTTEEYKLFREAGADRFLLRIETTDRKLYKKLHPGVSHENRINCLKTLKKLGYELGTGSLIGLPGQTIKSLAEDVLFFKNIGADMIGVGPFIPNQDTPLKDERGGGFEISLKVMALTRLLLPDINIPATTAMESLNPRGRLIALQSGANVVMPNVTEGKYRALYKLYPGKVCINDTPSHCRGCITNTIHSINRTVSKGYGFRKKVFSA